MTNTHTRTPPNPPEPPKPPGSRAALADRLRETARTMVYVPFTTVLLEEAAAALAAADADLARCEEVYREQLAHVVVDRANHRHRAEVAEERADRADADLAQASEALTEILAHPLISEQGDQDCDWHCVAEIQAVARRVLGASRAGDGQDGEA